MKTETPNEALLLTTAQVCGLLQITKPTVYQLARRHRWDKVSIGRAVRWRRTEVLKTVERLGRQMR